MEFIVNNRYIIFALLAIIVFVGILVVRYWSLPKEQRRSKIRQWLLWAVAEAEKELGGGTGKLKLRQVYDLFIQRFPWLSKILSFKRFMKLVDDALDELETMLESNKHIKNYVKGENSDGS